MRKVRLTITESHCRSGYCQKGDTFLVEDLCPPLCHELWHSLYPFVYALQNGGNLDCGETRAAHFTAQCPDGGRVRVYGEAAGTEEHGARQSSVFISMQDENSLGLSYAIVRKNKSAVLLIWKDAECAIFDYRAFQQENFAYRYRLLKHYDSPSQAYVDFMKLIGKMCKKQESSKYFLCPLDEDNRLVMEAAGTEHGITEAEKALYESRFIAFRDLVLEKRPLFRE